MVHARNNFFTSINLTPETHFIASTGIEGKSYSNQKNVCMDAYAIQGIPQNKIYYLQGATHLNPTHEYGVSFERGTVVEFNTYKKIFISGTASINNKGEIIHQKSITKQTHRTIENITVLLKEAHTSLENIQYCIVYIRDISDSKIVEKELYTLLPHIPFVLVQASVCRPAWLIEIECEAICSL